VPTAYSRVTLVNGARRVDLALPSALPLAEVMPQLLRFCAPDEKIESPAAWGVGRLGGPTLNLARTLDDSGVVDGEVLELRAAGQTVHPAYVEDVRDAVEDAVDGSGRQWNSRTTVAFALLVGALGLGAAGLLPEARRADDPVTLAAAVLIALLGVVAGWWSGSRGHRMTTPLVLATATGWGGIAGWLTAGYADLPLPGAVAAALTGGLLVAALARLLTPQATAHLAAWLVTAVAGAVLAAFGLTGNGVRLAGVLAVLVVGVLPRLSLTVGGLAGADYRVRNAGAIPREQFATRFRQSTALLYGGLVASAVTGAGAGCLLAFGPTWDRWLGVVIGVGLLLRSRVFSRTPSILPLRLAGLLVLGVHALVAVRQSDTLRPWTMLLAAGAATAGVALSAVPLSEVARARVKQLLNWAEVVVVVALVALAAGAVGAYAWVATQTA
jgi:type VII secretion integral membrane protein EccD